MPRVLEKTSISVRHQLTITFLMLAGMIMPDLLDEYAKDGGAHIHMLHEDIVNMPSSSLKQISSNIAHQGDARVAQVE